MRKTYQVHRGRCRNDNTFRNFCFAAPELRFVSTGAFKSQRNILFRRPYPLSSRQPPKPAKIIVSPPTSTLPYDNHRDRIHTYGVPSKLRPCNWSKSPPACQLVFVELADSSQTCEWRIDPPPLRDLCHQPLGLNVLDKEVSEAHQQFQVCLLWSFSARCSHPYH